MTRSWSTLVHGPMNCSSNYRFTHYRHPLVPRPRVQLFGPWTSVDRAVVLETPSALAKQPSEAERRDFLRQCVARKTLLQTGRQQPMRVLVDQNESTGSTERSLAPAKYTETV